MSSNRFTVKGKRLSSRTSDKEKMSDDDVWTPPETSRLTKLNATEGEAILEYVSRASTSAGAQENPYAAEEARIRAAEAAAAAAKTENKKKLSASKARQSQTSGKFRQSTASTAKGRQSQTSAKVRQSTASSVKGRQSQTSSAFRRYSGGGDHPSILLDWNNVSGWNRMLGFNLELWWRRSTMEHRLIAGIVALLLFIFFLNLFVGLWLIFSSVREPIRSPYVCETPSCQKAAQWMGQFMDNHVDPCDNFYEFVCGHYHHETEKEGDEFSHTIYEPAYTIEFGEDSILAKMLKNFKNDPSQDQSIEYYRSCLNIPTRKEYGLTAFLEAVEYVFGTRDLSTFEGINQSMEEVAARMFQVAGHASFLNMAFFTYPFIQIIRPTQFTADTFFGTPDYDNEHFVAAMTSGLFPLLGVGAALSNDMYFGFYQMSQIINFIDIYTYDIKMAKNVKESDASYQEFYSEVKKYLFDQNYCPPMGSIKLNMSEVLRLFLKEDDYRIDYLDTMSRKYHEGIQKCLDLGSSYVPGPGPPIAQKDPWTHAFTYPKTAFISLWVVELFWDFHSSMDYIDIWKDWNITLENYPKNRVVNDAFHASEDDSEYGCLISMWYNLGYMPTLRFLTATVKDPVEYMELIEDDIEKFFHQISDIFDRIPKEDIAIEQQIMGRKVFNQGIYVDLIMPIVSGYFDESAISELLHFTPDHLRNTFIAVNYTIESARQNWLGSTNTETTMKWWGQGEPNVIRYELLDLREPFIVPPPFEEVERAINDDKLVKFLTSPEPNYVLYPLSLMNEPHTQETLAIHFGTLRTKLIRTYLKLVQAPFLENRYTSMHWFDLLVVPNAENQNGGQRKCFVLQNVFNPEDPLLNETLYQYELEKTKIYDYSQFNGQNYYSLIALKEGFKRFKEFREILLNLPYNWKLGQQTRDLRTQRILPGKQFENVTEEQLFFLAFVRQTCRGSWKTHDDVYKPLRYELETVVLTILMQMHEFSEVWQCGEKSFMSNLGKDRCVRWNPLEEK